MISTKENAIDMALMSQAYAIAAQTPEIQISISKMSRSWSVDVKEIALTFDDAAGNGAGLLPMVKAAQAAYEAYIKVENELHEQSEEGMAHGNE